MSQPLDYKELLKKYIRATYQAGGDLAFNEVWAKVANDDSISEAEKDEVANIMVEVSDD